MLAPHICYTVGQIECRQVIGSPAPLIRYLCCLPSCSNASAVSPHDSNLGKILSQARRFIHIPSLRSRSPLTLHQSSATPADAACALLFAAQRPPWFAAVASISSCRDLELQARCRSTQCQRPPANDIRQWLCMPMSQFSLVGSADIMMIVGEASILLGRPFAVRAARTSQSRMFPAKLLRASKWLSSLTLLLRICKQKANAFLQLQSTRLATTHRAFARRRPLRRPPSVSKAQMPAATAALHRLQGERGDNWRQPAASNKFN